ncbi:MAG TPA: ATP-binding cassette domain-containing protein, partial [Lachnospiraceae bacterium]
MIELILDGVSKRIHKKWVLRNINLKMTSGHVYGLEGINGSGKTMLMRLVIGLIYANEGEVRINGRVLGKDMEFPESIGFLIENPSFLDAYSGLENLEFLTSIGKKLSIEELKKILNRVGLSEENQKKKYGKYSLGMKQRLGIAAAIMEAAQILVLDEPMNGLDEDGVALIRKIIEEERNRGALVLLSCHDKEILRSLSDEIVVI